MYADSEILFPYFNNFNHDIQQLEDFFQLQSHKSNDSTNNLIQSSTISEYDLGGEGDLFSAPKAIIGEPSVVSMINVGDDVISSQGLEVTDMESMQNGQLFSEVFYDCKRDLLAQSSIERPIFELFVMEEDIKFASANMEIIEKKHVCDELLLQKSVSSCCLSSMESGNEINLRPNFLDFPAIDFDSEYGMRRAFSEGDIKILGNGNASKSIVKSPSEHSTLVINCSPEERQEKLNRYRNKKTKRNFDRKIKYACRKALADNQPRVRGRFAKSE